jgi:hypothetical protein
MIVGAVLQKTNVNRFRCSYDLPRRVVRLETISPCQAHRRQSRFCRCPQEGTYFDIPIVPAFRRLKLGKLKQTKNIVIPARDNARCYRASNPASLSTRAIIAKYRNNGLFLTKSR